MRLPYWPLPLRDGCLGHDADLAVGRRFLPSLQRAGTTLVASFAGGRQVDGDFDVVVGTSCPPKFSLFISVFARITNKNSWFSWRALSGSHTD